MVVEAGVGAGEVGVVSGVGVGVADGAGVGVVVGLVVGVEVAGDSADGCAGRAAPRQMLRRFDLS